MFAKFRLLSCSIVRRIAAARSSAVWVFCRNCSLCFSSGFLICFGSNRIFPFHSLISARVVWSCSWVIHEIACNASHPCLFICIFVQIPSTLFGSFHNWWVGPRGQPVSSSKRHLSVAILSAINQSPKPTRPYLPASSSRSHFDYWSSRFSALIDMTCWNDPPPCNAITSSSICHTPVPNSCIFLRPPASHFCRSPRYSLI